MWLWEAYGYPKGRSNDIFIEMRRLGDESSPEYQKKALLFKQLSRLETLKKAIAEEREQNMKRDRDVDTLYQQNKELRRKIDRLRQDAQEPSGKLRKASDTEEDELRNEIRALRQENADLRQAMRPSMSMEALMDLRQKLERDIEQLELYQQVMVQQPIVLTAITRMGGGENLDQLKDFLMGPIYKRKAPRRIELATQLDGVLQRTAEYWKNKRLRSPQASAENLQRWEAYEQAALFYLQVVMPKIAMLELKPNETSLEEKAKAAGPLVAEKRKQLEQVQKDLLFYQKYSPLGCLVCGETRQSLLRQERNDPSKVFCGTLCQNKYYF